MAVSGNVSIAQDGSPAKLHPYLVAIVPEGPKGDRASALDVTTGPEEDDNSQSKDERWCVSCLWSTATVLLHRMMIKPVPQISGTAIKLSKPRPAGREHLHPEPKVESVVLHQPEVHNLDVIFVHGLYGSLCNTWRQGEWRSKYQSSPEKIHLRRPAASPSPCACLNCNKNLTNNNVNNHDENIIMNDENNLDIAKNSFNDKTSMVYYSEKENMYVFEDNKCDNMLDTHIDTNNYDNHDAFRSIDEKFYENFHKILPKDEVFITEKFYNNTLLDQVEIIDNYETQAQFVSDLFKNCDNSCDHNEKEAENEHVRNNIEQNKTNKICYENCMCMDKKCEVGCGCNCDNCYSPCWPQDWIKEDYPDARVISINYTSDPHLWRPIWVKENKRLCLHERAEQMTEQLLELGVGKRPVIWVGHSKGGLFIKQIYCEAYEAYLKTHPDNIDNSSQIFIQQNEKETENNNFSIMTGDIFNNNENIFNEEIYNHEPNNYCTDQRNFDCNVRKNTDEFENPTNSRIDNLLNRSNEDHLQSSNAKEDMLSRRASLWYNSGAFMFYSVPHRGSPLADIKIPIAARSIELMEISKDNSLVLSLQERWLRATAVSKPLVRSLVETRRTLMSVLWLRIVSTDSADPGIGALCGVSVDHREICKPSSRHCLLYTELVGLIKAGLNKFKLITS